MKRRARDGWRERERWADGRALSSMNGKWGNGNGGTTMAYCAPGTCSTVYADVQPWLVTWQCPKTERIAYQD